MPRNSRKGGNNALDGQAAAAEKAVSRPASTQATKDVVVKSPFQDNSDMFGNPASFPEVTLRVRGMESPIHLHKYIIAPKCCSLTEMLGTSDSIDLPLDVSNEADRNALIKVLQFCYGKPLSLFTDSEECCAVIATLIRLQVQNRQDAVKTILRSVISSSQQDLRVAALHLKTCVKYEECCTDECMNLDQMLSKIVLTRKNIEEHSDIVVDGCLMDLPPQFLDMCEYGEPHSETGAFCIRCRYVEKHKNDIDVGTLKTVMECVCSEDLNGAEFSQLLGLGVMDKDEVSKCTVKALRRKEVALADLQKRSSQRDRELTQKAASMQSRINQMQSDNTRLRTERDVAKQKLAKVRQELPRNMASGAQVADNLNQTRQELDQALRIQAIQKLALQKSGEEKMGLRREVVRLEDRCHELNETNESFKQESSRRCKALIVTIVIALLFIVVISILKFHR